MSSNDGKPIAALDVGTAKICCLVAEDEGDGVLRILGVGHKPSRGIRGGSIVDMEAAEESIRSAVHAAETMAGETIRSVTINLSCGRPLSQRFAVEVVLDGQEAADADVRRVLDEGYRLPVPDDRTAVHILFGDQLGVIMHVVSVTRGAVRNLSACAGHCHLDIGDLALSAEVAGRAVLVDDEMSLGSVCVDMGAGTTSIGAFADGALVFADSIPVGGAHITNDIAYGLSTPPADAERLKTLHGSAIAGGSDHRHMIDVPEIGETDDPGPNHVSRARLIEIIRPRVEETLELVRDRLSQGGVDEVGGRRVVLTGGASQLTGMRDLATQILDRPIRLGRPRPIRGLAESTSGPAFAVAAGLLAHNFDRDLDPIAPRRPSTREPAPSFGRIGQWLRENF